MHLQYTINSTFGGNLLLSQNLESFFFNGDKLLYLDEHYTYKGITQNIDIDIYFYENFIK